MERRAALVVLTVTGVLQTVQAETVAVDEKYFLLVKQKWSELVAPGSFFPTAFVLSVVLAIVGIALRARSKSTSVLSPLFAVPAVLLGFALWFFTRVPVTLAETYGDFGLSISQADSWTWTPFFFGSRWYGPLVICAVWAVTHPIVLCPHTGVPKGRSALLFLPMAGALILTIIWFYMVPMSPDIPLH